MTARTGTAGHALPGAALHALVVDDNHGAARMMGLALETMGARVAVAHDGHSAITVAREFKPHVVFMDISMTGMDGRMAARRIRAERTCGEVFLVAVSGWSQPEIEAMGGIADFDRYLPKPAGLSQLREVLDLCVCRGL